jgi:hypothetical protein
MAWLAGLMYCSMGGNLLILINNICIWTGLHSSKIFLTMQIWGFYLINLFFLFAQTALIYSTVQKVAYHCPWCTNNALVPITLRSLSANLCHGRTRNYWPTPHDCAQCSELYDTSNIVKLVSFFSLVFV